MSAAIQKNGFLILRIISNLTTLPRLVLIIFLDIFFSVDFYKNFVEGFAAKFFFDIGNLAVGASDTVFEEDGTVAEALDLFHVVGN